MAEKGATVIAMQTAMVPEGFWKQWQEMDERSKTALMLGNLRDLDTRVSELEERVTGLEEDAQEREGY